MISVGVLFFGIAILAIYFHNLPPFAATLITYGEGIIVEKKGDQNIDNGLYLYVVKFQTGGDKEIYFIHDVQLGEKYSFKYGASPYLGGLIAFDVKPK